MSVSSGLRAVYVAHMGDDLMVVNAARVSLAKHKTGPIDAKDAKLIDYLAKNRHWTPFGHPQACFRVTAPVFVAAQLKRHTVGAVVNEVSRRYVDDTPFFYRPTWRRRAEGVKQGSAAEFGSKDQEVRNSVFDKFHNYALDAYEKLLELDVAPELARAVLPQSMLTEWYWTGSLAFWARVCALRIHPHAQRESRVIAEDVSGQLAGLFPVSWKALREHETHP